MERALAGIKVVELATYVAAPCAGKFLADQGAEVIKIETLGGDNTRWVAENEGRPTFEDDPLHNLTFKLENDNKKSISMDLKDPDCYEALIKLIGQADVFITNWRTQALERKGLDYETLKKKFPKLVYASVTGYGEKGADADLPGFDFTAFWARSGMMGSLMDTSGEPCNLIPGIGDRAVGMSLAAGVLAALFRAQRTGKGDKVSCSIYGTAIFLQGTMVQTAQYGLVNYPITKRQSSNPFMNSFVTKDGRWVQIIQTSYDQGIRNMAAAFERPDWMEDPNFCSYRALTETGSYGAMYDQVNAEFAARDYEDIDARLKKQGIPFALCKNWKEVLKDQQAWDNGYLYEAEYKAGKVACVANPVQFEELGAPELKRFPLIGEQSDEILRRLGYSDEKIAELISKKAVRCEKA